jgi:hypothetical protein
MLMEKILEKKERKVGRKWKGKSTYPVARGGELSSYTYSPLRVRFVALLILRYQEYLVLGPIVQ